MMITALSIIAPARASSACAALTATIFPGVCREGEGGGVRRQTMSRENREACERFIMKAPSKMAWSPAFRPQDFSGLKAGLHAIFHCFRSVSAATAATDDDSCENHCLVTRRDNK